MYTIEYSQIQFDARMALFDHCASFSITEMCSPCGEATLRVSSLDL